MSNRRDLTFAGRLLHVHRTSGAGTDMEPCGQAELIAGTGVESDRYATRTGTYSDRHHIDRQVTLIEIESLDALERDHGVVLEPEEHRRNFTTEGVPLNHLVGRYFSVGECVLYGGRLNIPCAYLQELVGKPVFRPLVHRSGLNARVIVGGTVRPGDVIEPIDLDALDPELVADNEAHAEKSLPESN